MCAYVHAYDYQIGNSDLLGDAVGAAHALRDEDQKRVQMMVAKMRRISLLSDVLQLSSDGKYARERDV